MNRTYEPEVWEKDIDYYWAEDHAGKQSARKKNLEMRNNAKSYLIEYDYEGGDIDALYTEYEW